MKSETTNNWIVCRICLKQPTEQMRTIFDQNDEKDLTNLIFRCGGVPIKRFDHFPDKICSKCYKYLCVANKFRQTCQRSHQHLSKFIAPVVMESSMEDPIEPDILLQLGEHAVTLKMEPAEGLERESEKEIKKEQNEEYVDMFEPMHVDIPDMQNGEESVLSAEFDFFEEINQLSSEHDNDSESEVESFFADTSPQKKRLSKRNKSTNLKTNAAILKKQNTKSKMPAEKKQLSTPEKKRKSYKKPKESSYICDICGNIYPSQSRLTEHIKLHKGIKPYECEICGHAFAQTQQLTRHMNTHTGRRPYKCTYCPAAFADLSTRNKHHRIHTNERPYVCDVCGKSFTYTNTLKFHKMTHTGEKPHICDICGKGFQQAYKMRNHRLVHEKKGLKLSQTKKIPGANELLEI